MDGCVALQDIKSTVRTLEFQLKTEAAGVCGAMSIQKHFHAYESVVADFAHSFIHK